MRLHAQKNYFPTYESIDSMKEMYSYNVWSYSCNSPLTHWIFATANMFPSFLLLSQIILSVTKIITLHQLQEKIGLFWRMEHESTLILIKSCKYFVVNLYLSCTSFYAFILQLHTCYAACAVIFPDTTVDTVRLYSL